MPFLKKTNKLFFDRYAYKVSILTPVAAFFRGKKLIDTQRSLNELSNKFDSGIEGKIRIGFAWSKKYAGVGDVMVASKIIELLTPIDDYTLRVEGSILGVYVNNEELVDKISSINNITLREISKPENLTTKELLLSRPKIIIRKDYTHKYKITLKPLGDEPVFREWATKMSKIKINASTYRYGGYIYVADAKTLSICRLYLGNKVVKVEELVSHSEI